MHTAQQIMDSLSSYLLADSQTASALRQDYDAMLVETLNDLVIEVAGRDAVNLSQDMQNEILDRFNSYIAPLINTAVSRVATGLFAHILIQAESSNKENNSYRSIASQLQMIGQTYLSNALTWERALLNEALALAKDCLDAEDVSRPTTPRPN